MCVSVCLAGSGVAHIVCLCVCVCVSRVQESLTSFVGVCFCRDLRNELT